MSILFSILRSSFIQVLDSNCRLDCWLYPIIWATSAWVFTYLFRKKSVLCVIDTLQYFVTAWFISISQALSPAQSLFPVPVMGVQYLLFLYLLFLFIFSRPVGIWVTAQWPCFTTGYYQVNHLVVSWVMFEDTCLSHCSTLCYRELSYSTFFHWQLSVRPSPWKLLQSGLLNHRKKMFLEAAENWV